MCCKIADYCVIIIWGCFMEFYDMFLDNLPRIDLHGYDRESARVMTNDFVDEALAMGYERVLIVHGIGTGIVRGVVHGTLLKNKRVSKFSLVGSNVGCTIVYLDKGKG